MRRETSSRYEGCFDVLLRTDGLLLSNCCAVLGRGSILASSGDGGRSMRDPGGSRGATEPKRPPRTPPQKKGIRRVIELCRESIHELPVPWTIAGVTWTLVAALQLIISH